VLRSGSYRQRDALVFACPSNPAGLTKPDDPSVASFRRHVRFSYVANGRNNMAGSDSAPMNWQNLFRTDAIRNAGTLILLGEGGWDVDPAYLNNTANGNRWWFTHANNTQTYGYADAHVVSKRPTLTVSAYNEWSPRNVAVSASWLSTLQFIESSTFVQN